MSRKIDETKNEILNQVDHRLDQLRNDFTQDVELMHTRVENVERRIQDIVNGDHSNYSRTVVVTRLEEETGKRLLEQAQDLIRNGLGFDVPVARATRLQSRNGRPGLVNMELPSVEHKINVLRRNANFKSKPRYSNVYVCGGLMRSQVLCKVRHVLFIIAANAVYCGN